MNNDNVSCQLDTRSNLSIISENTRKKIGKPKLTSTQKIPKGVFGKNYNSN